MPSSLGLLRPWSLFGRCLAGWDLGSQGGCLWLFCPFPKGPLEVRGDSSSVPGVAAAKLIHATPGCR